MEIGNKRLKMGVDLDDVLAEFVPGLFDFYNKKSGTNWKKEDCKYFDLSKTWLEDAVSIKKTIEDFYFSPEFFNIVPVCGSRDVLEKLKLNSDIFIITDRPNKIAKTTSDWIDFHFPNIFKEIIFSNAFSSEDSFKRKKFDICNDLGVDVFIDDNFDHVRQCASKRKSFLFDAPWNREESVLENIQRVFSWNEIFDKLKDYQ